MKHQAGVGSSRGTARRGLVAAVARSGEASNATIKRPSEKESEKTRGAQKTTKRRQCRTGDAGVPSSLWARETEVANGFMVVRFPGEVCTFERAARLRTASRAGMEETNERKTGRATKGEDGW